MANGVIEKWLKVIKKGLGLLEKDEWVQVEERGNAIRVGDSMLGVGVVEVKEGIWGREGAA